MSRTETITWHEIEEDGLPEVTDVYLVVPSFGHVLIMHFNPESEFFDDRGTERLNLPVRWAELPKGKETECG